MKLLLAILLTALQIAAVYFGWIDGQKWALNIMSFLSWLAFVLAILVILTPRELKKDIERPALSVSVSYSVYLFTCLVGIMVGKFFYGFAWLFFTVISYDIFKHQNNQDKAQEVAE